MADLRHRVARINRALSGSEPVVPSGLLRLGRSLDETPSVGSLDT
jgi:hypothetical protein